MAGLRAGFVASRRHLTARDGSGRWSGQSRTVVEMSQRRGRLLWRGRPLGAPSLRNVEAREREEE